MSQLDDRAERERELTWWELIEGAFDREELARICTMRERRFPKEFGLKKFKVERPAVWQPGTGVRALPSATPNHLRPVDDFYAFKDNGASILAVAHLDTCVWANERMCDFAETADGPVVHSGALDDRLGAYVILDMLPKLGVNADVLLTTGEETGKSTAKFFRPPKHKEYNWMIEFDRGGTDVVMYQYDSTIMDRMVRSTGATTANGAFSDISYLEHLGIKGFNWGVGYHDYHSVRGYAYIYDLFEMLVYFMKFHEEYADIKLEHDPKDPTSGRGKGRNWGSGGLYGSHGDWRSQSSYSAWWDDALDKRDKEANNKTDDKEGESVDKLGSVLDRIDVEAEESEVGTISLDQLIAERGIDEVDAALLKALPGKAPTWGDSLASDPTDIDFVSPA